MPLYASPIRVVFDPSGIGGTAVELVKYDDYLTSWIQFSGGQSVSLVDRIGAAGRKGFSKLNEYSTIPLAWMRQYETPAAAFVAKMTFMASRPKRRATVAFYPEDWSSGSIYFVSSDALLTNWSARNEGSNVYYGLTIEGGYFATS